MEIVEIEVEVIGTTELAWRVRHADGECWLPKSEVEIVARAAHGPFLAVMPEWLAEREGMV